MNSSLNINDLAQTLSKFLRRFHGTIFFILLGTLLGAAILSIINVNNLVNQPPEVNSSLISSSFDEGTILRVKDLGSTPAYQPKAGDRTNPFLE